MAAFRCPSDIGISSGNQRARLNYGACLGDAVRGTHGGWGNERNRGAFRCRYQLRFADILDGLSNTIACGEFVTDSGTREVKGSAVLSLGTRVSQVASECRDAVVDPARPLFYLVSARLSGSVAGTGTARGHQWNDGLPHFSGINTVVPPNGPTCMNGGTGSFGMYTAGSRHVGGCHILLADGSIQFITENIDAGDQTVGPVSAAGADSAFRFGIGGEQSPFGVWGALGSRASKESVPTDF